MGLPIWVTKSGNLGTIPEAQYYRFGLEADDSVNPTAPILFELVAGQMPVGIHIDTFGFIAGNPQTQIKVLGVPSNVSQAVSSKFAIRARTPDYFTTLTGDGSSTRYVIPEHIDFDVYNVVAFQDGNPISSYYAVDNTQTNNVTIIFLTTPTAGSTLIVGLYSPTGSVADRTFELTIVGENAPQILTVAESLGEYYGGGYVEYQINVQDLDNDTLTLSVVNGSLPDGLSLSQTGLISGYINPISFDPTSTVDYVSVYFSVLVDDTKRQGLHNFQIDIYPAILRDANNDITTIDSDFVTADTTTRHSPVVYNESGSIGTYKHDNYFMYQFNGYDFDGDIIAYTYDFGVGQGYDQTEAPFDEADFDTISASSSTLAFPPDLALDPDSGWLYGYIQPLTAIITGDGSTLSFDITGLISWTNYYITDNNGMIYNSPGDYSVDADTITFTTAPAIGTTITIQGLEATYTFYVRAYKKYYTEQSDPQGGPDVYYYSIRKPYTLTITGAQPGTLTWISDTNLGTIENGGISEFQIQATVDNGNTLYYELVSGAYNRVPSAMSLQSDGLIIGRASFATFSIDGGITTFDVNNQFVATPTTFDQSFSFTIRVYDLEGTVNETKTFTITILKVSEYPYEDLYLIGRLPLADRTKFRSIVNNTHLIPAEDVYRPTDTYFGVQEDLRMLVVNGLFPSEASDYIAAMQTMHYRKQLLLGDIKTAIVVDSNYNTLYEVVYVQVIDKTNSKDGTPVTAGIDISKSNVPNQSIVYPNNIIDMRRSLIQQIGQINKELPSWMSSRQSNGKVLGFTLGCVLAYVLPGKGSKIAYQLNNLKNLAIDHPYYIDFKKIILDVDRYVWDNELTANFNKSTLKYETENETLFDVHVARFPYTLDYDNIPVYPFNSTIFIHDHYGTEYVLDPTSVPRASRTTFDHDSLHFSTGRDSYTPQDVNDKYLAFPRQNILG